jgi:sigma-B regulation protein RsbU (phosphoserine phosphatase)
VFYTDGVTEAVDLADEDFGQERLEKVLCEHSRETADRVVAAVFTAVAAHANGLPASDDQTVIAVRT